MHHSVLYLDPELDCWYLRWRTLDRKSRSNQERDTLFPSATAKRLHPNRLSLPEIHHHSHATYYAFLVRPTRMRTRLSSILSQISEN